MKKCTMLMALAAMMVVAPMLVSAHCGSCGSDTKKSAKKTCCASKGKKCVKKECTKKECKKDCKCAKKEACTKEACKDGCKCPKKADAKKKK